MSLAQPMLPFVDSTSADVTPDPEAVAASTPRTTRRRPPQRVDVIADGITKMHLHRRGNPAHMDRDVLRLIGGAVNAALRLLTTRPKSGGGALWSPGHALYTRLALQPVSDLAKAYFSDDQMKVLEWAQEQVVTEAKIRQARGTLPSPRNTQTRALKELADLLSYSIDVLSVNADLRPTRETKELGSQVGSVHDCPVALI